MINILAGKYCGSDGLSEPTGDCAPGYYCSGGAYTDRPTLYPVSSERYTLNDTICPIYSVNETGDVCSPGKSCSFCLDTYVIFPTSVQWF